MRGKVIDMTGQRFGKLVVLGLAGMSRHRVATWNVRCDCGKEREVPGTSLRSGNTTTCGCSRWRHGMRRSRLYGVWRAMIERCTKPKNKSFPRYGGRGIGVCERWRTSFAAFLADMGPPPPGCWLDRIENDGNYEPGNVRWLPVKQQQRNKSTNRIVIANGERATVAEWAERTGIAAGTISMRLRMGWSAPRAVTTPVRSFVGRDRASSPPADTACSST